MRVVENSVLIRIAESCGIFDGKLDIPDEFAAFHTFCRADFLGLTVIDFDGIAQVATRLDMCYAKTCSECVSTKLATKQIFNRSWLKMGILAVNIRNCDRILRMRLVQFIFIG